MIEDFDLVYEDDGDDLGPLMGFVFYGRDVDLDDVDMALNTGEIGEYADDLGPDFEAEQCWVRKVPSTTYGYRFVYARNAGPGARRCVRVDVGRPTTRWCVNHPYEPYRSGIPVQQVADPPWPKVIDGYVHLCADCSRRYRARVDVARAAQMLAYYEREQSAHAERARNRLADARAKLTAIEAAAA